MRKDKGKERKKGEGKRKGKITNSGDGVLQFGRGPSFLSNKRHDQHVRSQRHWLRAGNACSLQSIVSGKADKQAIQPEKTKS